MLLFSYTCIVSFLLKSSNLEINPLFSSPDVSKKILILLLEGYLSLPV